MQPFSVVVFAKNEETSIEACLASIAASPVRNLRCTLIVNGSTDATAARATAFAATTSLDLTIHSCAAASKAHGWNRYIHDIRPDAGLHLFVDAYAQVEPDAFAKLAQALDAAPEARAATSVPTSGRTAESTASMLRRHGGLHGTLHALRGSFVEEIVRRGLRLPYGLYRGDGLIGAMAMHNLDPRRNGWQLGRVAVVDGRTWTRRPFSPLNLSHLRRHFGRLVMQARGRMENKAIGRLIEHGGFEALPEDADRMLRDWLSALPAPERTKIERDFLTRRAIAALRDDGLPPDDQLALRRIWPVSGEAPDDAACKLERRAHA